MSGSVFVAKALTVVGTIVLVHAAYSANQYKGLVHAQGGGGESSKGLPPVDVLVECLVSFLLILVGQLLPLSLESIVSTPDKKVSAFDDRFGAPEFVRFNHRGRYFKKRLAGR